MPTFLLQRILRRLTLRHVDYAMHIEHDLLAVGRPVLVTKAVRVSAVDGCVEGVVAGGDGGLVDLEAAGGKLYLHCPLRQHIYIPVCSRVHLIVLSMCREWDQCTVLFRQGCVCVHTQKSISKFPLPPNSRSPTWNVTVILSSLCNVSWKHSRECALIWILCAWLQARRVRSESRS